MSFCLLYSNVRGCRIFLGLRNLSKRDLKNWSLGLTTNTVLEYAKGSKLPYIVRKCLNAPHLYRRGCNAKMPYTVVQKCISTTKVYLYKGLQKIYFCLQILSVINSKFCQWLVPILSVNSSKFCLWLVPNFVCD